MRIALIRRKYSPFGGAERYIDALVKHLLASGHEMHIFAHEWEPATQNSQFATGRLFFHRVPMIKGLSLFKVLSFAINASRLLKKERFDVIHSFERTLFQDIYRAGDGCHKEWLIQRAKYEPFWKTCLVRINPLHFAFLWIERQLFDPRNTRMVVANSMRGKLEIVRHYHFPEDRIRVVYNGVDTARFNPLNRKKYRPAVRECLGLLPSYRVVLFLGSGFERKGLSFALRVVAALRDPLVRLIVAGKDNCARYRKLASRLGITDRVVFTGPTKEPEKLYAAADIFLLPTIYEPFSNACLEALASGIPVITSRTNGASERISEGMNGYIIDDPSDIFGMKREIMKFLNGTFRHNVDIQRSDISWESHVEVMSFVYDELVRAKQSDLRG